MSSDIYVFLVQLQHLFIISEMLTTSDHSSSTEFDGCNLLDKARKLLYVGNDKANLSYLIHEVKQISLLKDEMNEALINWNRITENFRCRRGTRYRQNL